MEGAEILVNVVVFVVAAELLQGARDFGFFFRHEIAPDFAIGELQLGGNGAVGIDMVAGMDEEIRAILQHGAIAAISAARDVDAPALPRRVAGPHERDRLTRCRRRAEMSDARLACDPGGNVVEAHAVENILPRRQPVQQRSCGEIGIRSCVR
jgi:hypothetical protein